MGSPRQMFKKKVLAASVAALASVSYTAVAQDAPVEEVLVTGIRAALENAMDIKRDSKGVVDAINAEDIGKFPTTNLAESLQRIPGVSINRVNGEGSQITVRGFGPGFNQVTLNGRSMPTADIAEVGSGVDGQGAVGGDGRAFDFSNLAADGVKTLEVYKTGRADIASGGIGATVNVVTRNPLDSDSGFNGTVGVKAIMDTSVERGDSVTPEFGGLVGWTNDDQTFGVSLFGSYNERHSAAASATSAEWTALNYYGGFDSFNRDGGGGVVNEPSGSEVNNVLVTSPRDSRYHLSEFESERLNGQLVFAYEPRDDIRLKADYTFAVNEAQERRSDVSNWFGRNYTDVTFTSELVPATVYIQENTDNQGGAHQQTLRATKDKLGSFGFNAEFDVSDTFVVAFDAHTSKAEVIPNIDYTPTVYVFENGAPVLDANGNPVTVDVPAGVSRVNIGLDMRYAPVNGTVSHGVDYSGDVPVQNIVLVQTAENANMDGAQLADLVVDPARAAAQFANLNRVAQENEIDQFDLRGAWELDGDANVTAGVNYRSQTNITASTSYQHNLGNWGGENPGDVLEFVPGGLEEYCLSCAFDDYTIGGATLNASNPNSVVHGVRGNAEEIYAALAPQYTGTFNPATGNFENIYNPNGNAYGQGDRVVVLQNDTYDEIIEDVLSLYVAFDNEFQVGGKDAFLNFGLRYEDTTVTAKTSSLPTKQVNWLGNNDFSQVANTDAGGFELEGSYSHWLPNIDFSVDVTADVRARASYSKTIARASYNNLFASGSTQNPAGPTALPGNQPSASIGNPELKPLESENIDLSVEWYYGDASYVSIGLFDKRVSNFVGTEVVDQNLYGVQDVTSGAPGTRSGVAAQILRDLGVTLNEDNLFAATVYVDQELTAAGAGANVTDAAIVTAARDSFVANQNAEGNIDSDEYDRLENTADVLPRSEDPLLVYGLSQPINNEDAKIHGIELQGQHFFGDTGFGVAGSFTMVSGDVSFNDAGNPSASQFALLGLSDTANITLIYENFGFSGRLAYNWRDEFLSGSNIGSNNNPLYTDAYGQIDLSLGYDVNDDLSFSFDVINLNEESSRTFHRSDRAMAFARENGMRMYLNARYKF